MSDADVWLEIMDRAVRGKGVVLDNETCTVISFGCREFLRSIRRAVGGSALRQIEASIRRMQATSLHLSHDFVRMVSPDFAASNGGSRKFVDVQLLSVAGGELEPEHGMMMVSVPKVIVSMYRAGYSYVDMDVHTRLKSNYAKWLHLYIASNRASDDKPLFISYDYVRERCGTQSASPKRFRQLVRQALNELLDAGIVSSVEPIFTGSRKQTAFRVMRKAQRVTT